MEITSIKKFRKSFSEEYDIRKKDKLQKNICLKLIDMFEFPSHAILSNIVEEIINIHNEDTFEHTHVSLFCIYDDYIRLSVSSTFPNYFINKLNEVFKNNHPIVLKKSYTQDSINSFISCHITDELIDICTAILDETGYRILNGHLVQIPRDEEHKKIISKYILETESIRHL